MRYFVKRIESFESKPKNKLVAEVRQVAKVKDRKILDDINALDAWISNLREHVQLANQNNPRCKPLKVWVGDWTDHVHSCNVWISLEGIGGSFVQFKVYTENV